MNSIGKRTFIPNTWKRQYWKPNAGQVANRNKDAKTERNVKERETGLLIPDLCEALGHTLPQNLRLLYFPAHL